MRVQTNMKPLTLKGGAMKKMLIALIGCIFLSVASCVVDNAQRSERGPAKTAKTISLPSGEVIHDLNGEWDAIIDLYGLRKEGVSAYKQIIKIAQERDSFVGLQMIDDEWMSKGSRRIDGVLAKGGFDYVNLYLPAGIFRANGQISEDGKSIVLDDWKMVRFTLTRK
jgi:hypothetical protein